MMTNGTTKNDTTEVHPMNRTTDHEAAQAAGIEAARIGLDAHRAGDHLTARIASGAAVAALATAWELTTGYSIAPMPRRTGSRS